MYIFLKRPDLRSQPEISFTYIKNDGGQAVRRTDGVSQI